MSFKFRRLSDGQEAELVHMLLLGSKLKSFIRKPATSLHLTLSPDE